MRCSGIRAVDGMVAGKALHYAPYDYTRESLPCDSLTDTAQKAAAYEGAKAKAHQELCRAIEALPEGARENAEILSAHETLLEDVAIDEEIYQRLESGEPLSQAIIQTYDMFIGMLAETDSPLIKERIADMKDVRSRLIRCLAGKSAVSLSSLEEPVVIVSKGLTPSDTASIDREHILAILTEEGGLTSHTVIIARNYSIPTIVGIQDIFSSIPDGEELLVDACSGTVTLQPSAEERAAFDRAAQAFSRKSRLIRQYQRREAVTLCGARLMTEVNISAPDMLTDEPSYSDGVGLFRSEFLYLGRKELPDEQSQYLAYKAAAQAFGDKPVILRTLDIGGDKQLDCLELPKEDNPFLGKRAIRLCFADPALFMTQLRAALRASVHGNLWLMFPMIGSVEDWHRCCDFVHRAMEELDREHIPYNADIPLGVMIEIPSAALSADILAREVSFASIGTNDLCQYLMAADRMNPSVAEYCQPYHPALLRVIRTVADAFEKEGKYLGVCGEMGGQEKAVLLLMGLGIRAFSMSAPNIAVIKRLICNTSLQEAADVAQAASACTSAADISALLDRGLQQIQERAKEREEREELL